MFKKYQFSLILAKRELCRKDWNQSEDWEKLLHVKGLGGLEPSLSTPLTSSFLCLVQALFSECFHGKVIFVPIAFL